MNAEQEHPVVDAQPKRGIARLFRATIIRETAWLAAGFTSKLLIQMGTLYYLTHGLGVERVGIFFALISMFACIVPFVQLGNYDLTIRQIARRENPQAVAGRAMRSSVACFFVLLPIVLLLRPVLAGQVGWIAYLMVATGELLVMRIVTNVQALATGFRLHYVCAVSDFLLGLSRFIAVFAASKLGGGLDAMLMLYAFTSVPAAIATYGWMVRRYGSPHWRGGSVFSEFRDHQRMVIAWFSEMAAREGDKPLLLALSTSAQTGIYGTATKLFLVCLVPIDLLTQVFRPRVGQAYGDSEKSGKHTGRLMTMTLVGIGFLITAGMFAVLMLLPHFAPQLAESRFGEARIALIYLAFLPPIYGLQRANVITAISRGTTGIYATSTAISAAISALTIWRLAPIYGWRGACAGLAVFLTASSIAIYVLTELSHRKTSREQRLLPSSLAEQIDESLAELTNGVSAPIQ